MRIAINGLGRIGRLVLRNAWDDPDVEIVAANSRSGAGLYAHLLKYDSSYGIWDKKIEAPDDDTLVIDGKTVKLLHQKEPASLPWKDLNIDVVVESTGKFNKRDEAAGHLDAGAKYVMISAPAKEEDVTLMYQMNHDEFDPEKHKVISAASCTTTCLTPLVKVLQEKFGIVHGFVNTIHAYTNDQNLQDAPHKDLRRSRASATSIIPTTTGATKAVIKLVPELEGKLNGIALRVPIPVPSVVCFTAELAKETTVEEVNNAFKEAAKNWPDFLAVSEEPLVSIDYKGSTFGSTVDALSTEVVDKKLVTVLSWYDNEWGYVTNFVRLLKEVGKKI